MSCMGKMLIFQSSFGHECGYIVLVHVMNNNKKKQGGEFRLFRKNFPSHLSGIKCPKLTQFT